MHNPEDGDLHSEHGEQADPVSDDIVEEVLNPMSGKVLQNKAPDKPRKRSMRLGFKILIGVAAFLVAVVGGGALVYATQHANPLFCNAVCHSPMDPYVEGYESGDAGLLVTAHATAGEVCLNCHESNWEQQIDEGMKWMTGDFRDPMVLRRFGTEAFCLRSGCHTQGGTALESYEALAATTVNYQESGYNPHQSPHGSIECYNCHSVHNESKLYCSNCHKDVPVPASW